MWTEINHIIVCFIIELLNANHVTQIQKNIDEFVDMIEREIDKGGGKHRLGNKSILKHFCKLRSAIICPKNHVILLFSVVVFCFFLGSAHAQSQNVDVEGNHRCE